MCSRLLDALRQQLEKIADQKRRPDECYSVQYCQYTFSNLSNDAIHEERIVTGPIKPCIWGRAAGLGTLRPHIPASSVVCRLVQVKKDLASWG